MTIKTMQNGFLGISGGMDFRVPYQKAKAVVIPFGMEKTVSYGTGAKNGPLAIIRASHQLEGLDEQTLIPFHKCGITTLQTPKIPKQEKASINLLGTLVKQTLADEKFPIVLGGEHSLTQGTVKGLSEKYQNYTVLQFDAHSDTREEYYQNPYSHGAVMHQVLQKYPVAKLVQVGIRSLSNQNGELAFRQKNRQKIKTFWGWENPSPIDVVKAIPTREVFISFDVDAFDSSLMPSTGTPEPGGLFWWTTLEILKTVFNHKTVIGADVVELSPIKNLHAPDFMVARLVYKMIGYKFFNTQTLTK